MKIAITADVHLTSYERNPERFHALENILDQLIEHDIDHLIIAGDLFDSACKHPAEIEKWIAKEKFSHLTVYILPGNHDPALSKGTFTAKNIRHLTEPELLTFSEDVQCLFLPYRPGASIGEVLAAYQDELEQTNWVLFAHGDYLSSANLRNAYEEGLYMPLSGRDIQVYRPRKVFLGHIHLPYDSPILYYPGSPCGLDITETGIRSFLIYDTSTGKVARQLIKTDVIFFQEILTVLPLEDEVTHLKNALEKEISRWELTAEQKQVVRARILVQGYSSNRERVSRAITDYMFAEKIALIEPVDLSRVKISDDRMRGDIVSSVQNQLVALGLPDDADEPTLDDYMLSAMSQVYGG